MNEAFKVPLSLSCSGALLIVLFRLCRPLFRSRLSKQWQYYIWLVVVVRLLLPFAPEINLMGAVFQSIENGKLAQIQAALSPAQDIPCVLVSQDGGRVTYKAEMEQYRIVL